MLLLIFNTNPDPMFTCNNELKKKIKIPSNSDGWYSVLQWYLEFQIKYLDVILI